MCFIKRRYFFGTIGSWDRVLIFLSYAWRAGVQRKSKASDVLNFFDLLFLTRAVCCSSHTPKNNHPLRSILYTPPHTHLEFVSRDCLSLTSMIFLGFAISCSGIVTAGSVVSFSFHADSLTRLSTWRKERSLLPSRTAAGKETKHQHIIQNAFTPVTNRRRQHQSPASPGCTAPVCRNPTVSSVCRHRIS